MHCWMNEILAWFKNMLLKRGWMWTGTAEEPESSPTLTTSPEDVPRAPTSTNSFGIFLSYSLVTIQRIYELGS